MQCLGPPKAKSERKARESQPPIHGRQRHNSRVKMARSKYQILVIPYFRCKTEYLFCVFQRSDNLSWQWIAGGGENSETPIEAARRESNEEAGISTKSSFLKLQTISSIPACHFKASKSWGKSTFVIPEYSFAVKLKSTKIRTSSEHFKFKWLKYNNAMKALQYDSNKTALWELNCRLSKTNPWSNHL